MLSLTHNGDIAAQVQFLGREDPLEEAWQPTPVVLPGESHGQMEPGGKNLFQVYLSKLPFAFY